MTPIEELESLQSDIEELGGAIYHAIDAVAISSRLKSDALDDDVDEAKQYAEDMKRKMRRMIVLLGQIREREAEDDE